MNIPRTARSFHVAHLQRLLASEESTPPQIAQAIRNIGGLTEFLFVIYGLQHAHRSVGPTRLVELVGLFGLDRLHRLLTRYVSATAAA